MEDNNSIIEPKSSVATDDILNLKLSVITDQFQYAA